MDDDEIIKALNENSYEDMYVKQLDNTYKRATLPKKKHTKIYRFIKRIKKLFYR